MRDIEYIQSLCRCPICGGVFGARDGECNVQTLRDHVIVCREESRVKPIKMRQLRDE